MASERLSNKAIESFQFLALNREHNVRVWEGFVITGTGTREK
jgi:hypothetical protein